MRTFDKYSDNLETQYNTRCDSYNGKFNIQMGEEKADEYTDGYQMGERKGR